MTEAQSLRQMRIPLAVQADLPENDAVLRQCDPARRMI